MRTNNVLRSHEVRSAIGSLIKDAREAKGLTRYELAMRASMQETHLRRIEEGGYAVRVDIFNHLCNTLGIEATFPIVE